MTRTPDTTKQRMIDQFLTRLGKDDDRVFEEFLEWARRPELSAAEIEDVHEFIEEAANRIRNSRAKLDRIAAAMAIVTYFETDSRRLGIHERFLASTCRALSIYFQNRKMWDPAIAACEFLVRRGIPDEDGTGFHVKLDALYRLQARR